MSMPIASALGGILDFMLAFIVLIGMIYFYGLKLSADIIWLPFFLILSFITSLGASLWLSALYVKFHDVRHIIPFLVQFWLFATPIAYPSSLLQEPWLTLYGMNPMTGVVEGFRWALLGVTSAPGPIIIVSSLVALGLLLSGAFFFRRMEKTFADVI
jgi:lipopolysaccharide transport system permease protein